MRFPIYGETKTCSKKTPISTGLSSDNPDVVGINQKWDQCTVKWMVFPKIQHYDSSWFIMVYPIQLGTKGGSIWLSLLILAWSGELEWYIHAEPKNILKGSLKSWKKTSVHYNSAKTEKQILHYFCRILLFILSMFFRGCYSQTSSNIEKCTKLVSGNVSIIAWIEMSVASPQIERYRKRVPALIPRTQCPGPRWCNDPQLDEASNEAMTKHPILGSSWGGVTLCISRDYAKSQGSYWYQVPGHWMGVSTEFWGLLDSWYFQTTKPCCVTCCLFPELPAHPWSIWDIPPTNRST